MRRREQHTVNHAEAGAKNGHEAHGLGVDIRRGVFKAKGRLVL